MKHPLASEYFAKTVRNQGVQEIMVSRKKKYFQLVFMYVHKARQIHGGGLEGGLVGEDHSLSKSVLIMRTERGVPSTISAQFPEQICKGSVQHAPTKASKYQNISN